MEGGNQGCHRDWETWRMKNKSKGKSHSLKCDYLNIICEAIEDCGIEISLLTLNEETLYSLQRFKYILLPRTYSDKIKSDSPSNG